MIKRYSNLVFIPKWDIRRLPELYVDRLGEQKLTKHRDPETTSRIMATIHRKGGKADQALGRMLWQLGLRYRRKSDLTGRPDLVFVKARVVVFVDGDFWHGRWLDERIARGDFTRNADYWIPKLRRNAQRDVEVNRRLADEGWLVIRVWESEILKGVDGVAIRVADVVKKRQECDQPKDQ